MTTLRLPRGISITAASISPQHRHHPAVHVRAVGHRYDIDDVASSRGSRKGNWVTKILRVNSLWAKETENPVPVSDAGTDADCDTCAGCSGTCVAEEEDEGFDVSRFSELLTRVSMVELEVYAKMSYLGILAYNIPKIKPASLLKHHGLRFVTSALEKKSQLRNSDTEKDTKPEEQTSERDDNEQRGILGYKISPSAAYDIVATAASYLHSQTKTILPFGTDNQNTEASESNDDQEVISGSDVASFVATTNSVTAVVAGKEEMKEAVAKDLNSAQSSPCEWFICDDDKSNTRYFVIQGSESLASWQGNLLFEPIQFEGMDVLVHRGIYEIAKGIYQQMLPEIRAHLESRGRSATLRFTGHSLGGSLSLLVNLMLLIRCEAPISALLPVITFGAPSIMCGGDYLLEKLGLPESHVQAITLHRDIVPRAFSCKYPDNVTKILKALNGNFRNLPCLINQKILYAPMGKLLILQPEEKISPHHDLLPPGSGLYLLDHRLSENQENSTRILHAAKTVFLNTPHPLEILSDRSAYGSEGTIFRDHDVLSYVRSVRFVYRQELKLIRKARREQRRILWWPLVTSDGTHPRVTLTRPSQHHFVFVGVLEGGKATLKRFGKILSSHNVNMFLVFLFPVRALLMGTLSRIKMG